MEKKEVEERSYIKKMNKLIDKEGIIRVGGRLKK